MLSLLQLIGIGAFLQDSEEERRQSARVYSAVIGVMLLLYGVGYLVTGIPRVRLQAQLQVAEALLLLAVVRLLAVREATPSRLLEWVVVLGATVICLTLATMGGVTGDAVFWTFPLPFLVFLLLGQRTGWIVNLAHTVGAPLLMLATSGMEGFWPYAPERVVWYGMAYLFNVLAAASFNLLRSNFKARLQELVDLNTAEARRHLGTLQFNAVHDVPSGLLNREGLLAALPSIPGGVTVACIHFDRIVELANIVGMATVDGALRTLGERLDRRFPAGVLVARLGPADLAVALRHAPGAPADAPTEAPTDALADTPVRALLAVLDGGEPAADAGGYSIGNEYAVGYAAGGMASSRDEAAALLRQAEQALRHAVRHGGRVQAYDRALDEASVRYHTRYEKLRLALQRDDVLQLHYQPLVQLRTGALVGAEALARWVDADEGPIPPDQFIPILERTGLLLPFTLFTIRRAVRDCAAWQGGLPGVAVSVNLSAGALVEPTVIDALEAAIRDAALPPGLVHVEVTETVLMRSPAAALAMMERLVARGVHLSIDDYGMGYSSLSYLRMLPAQSLKIDKAFILALADQPRVQAIVDSTIALAHDLGMAVVAEGVETSEAEERLQALRCDVGQGWLYARALPVDAFVRWGEARRETHGG